MYNFDTNSNIILACIFEDKKYTKYVVVLEQGWLFCTVLYALLAYLVLSGFRYTRRQGSDQFVKYQLRVSWSGVVLDRSVYSSFLFYLFWLAAMSCLCLIKCKLVKLLIALKGLFGIRMEACTFSIFFNTSYLP